MWYVVKNEMPTFNFGFDIVFCPLYVKPICSEDNAIKGAITSDQLKKSDVTAYLIASLFQLICKSQSSLSAKLFVYFTGLVSDAKPYFGFIADRRGDIIRHQLQFLYRKILAKYLFNYN